MRKFRLPLGAGSEPELIEIDDAREAVGACDDFNLCDRSPHGQHEFFRRRPIQFRFCIHCGKAIAA